MHQMCLARLLVWGAAVGAALANPDFADDLTLQVADADAAIVRAGAVDFASDLAVKPKSFGGCLGSMAACCISVGRGRTDRIAVANVRDLANKAAAAQRLRVVRRM